MLLGWTNSDILWPELCTENQHQISIGLRRVGDRSSFIIKLDVCGVQQALIPDAVIEHAQFEICTKPDQAQPPPPPIFNQQPQASGLFRQQQPSITQKGQFYIRTQKLVSPALRHVYVYASHPWYKFVAERLQR
jgi:hypothetical protein